jgi:hypothetical protein
MPIQHPLSANNGEQIWYDSDLLDKLRYGDAISGWSGDPNINLLYDNTDHRIYVTSFDDNKQPYIICRSLPDIDIDSMNLLHMLVSHDRNRRGGFDVGKEMDENDAKIDADKAANDNAALEDVAKKLAWGFRKDLH